MQPDGQAPSVVRQTIAILAVVWAILFAVAAIPAVRPPWETSVSVREVENGLLLGDPITSFVTPYVSFIRPSDGSAFDRDARVAIVAGTGAIESAADLARRTLIIVAASDTTAHQFAPSQSVRAAITGAHKTVTEITIGYDGRAPAVSVIRYWWPWMLMACVLSLILTAVPFTWPIQRRVKEGVEHVVSRHRPIVWLMFAAAAARLLLILRGGQYFDWDESRYGGGAAWMFSYLTTGNFEAALGMLLKSPDHPGFRVVGMVPAFFHVASAWPTGRAVTDMRVPTGEWLPAFLLSLASVCTIGLTYALAVRLRASRFESFLAAFLMLVSSSMLSYARHFFPYDVAMAMLLFAVWLGLDGRMQPWRSLAVGFLIGLGFLTYEGYWLLGLAAACLHVLQSRTLAGVTARVGWLVAGAAICPGLVALAALSAHRPFIGAVKRFAETAVNGQVNEGWSLPWAYLWHAEHGLLLCYLIGAIALMAVSLSGDRSRLGASMWLTVGAGIYLSLVLGSNVFHRFVVYDRLARQMLPFLSLAAAAGLSALTPPRFRYALCTAIALVAVPNWVTVFAQRFPRDIAIEAVRHYGAGNVGIRMTISGVDNATVPLFLPLDDPAAALSRPRRYILTDAQDIWVPGGASDSLERPPGQVLLSTSHPRQLKSMQYHGYRPAERRFLRSIDFPIQLIDTQSDRSVSSR